MGEMHVKQQQEEEGERQRQKEKKKKREPEMDMNSNNGNYSTPPPKMHHQPPPNQPQNGNDSQSVHSGISSVMKERNDLCINYQLDQVVMKWIYPKNIHAK